MKTPSIFIVILPTILLTSAHHMGAPNYECGPHGRFEYCINGNPGCVVGCHCHPGYYFDTESKICEANNKLRLNYRREYDMPTPTPYTTTKLTPTPTEPSIIDRNMDAIGKDADDLGDWLYNQFFKAIENQVINKTNEEKTPSRRSGTLVKPTTKPPTTTQPVIQRRSRTRRKHAKKPGKKKKRHSKKGGLRKKLLRISEDDSLFDSSSASSESSDESSSEGSSETSSSNTESESSESSKSREHSSDHGHRKILMINKKPHPPLPSFIFMPNMETPYFPPLGLPPPPVMPMYPIIPIPPMIPSISIIQSTPAAESQATTAATQVTTAATTQTQNCNRATAAPTTAAPASEAPGGDGPGGDPPGETDAPGDDAGASEAPPGRSGLARKYRKGNARNKFMKKLRDKMKRRHELPQSINYFPDEVNDPMLGGMNNMPEAFPEPFMYDESREPDPMLPGQDVNFKYLSQLIHKNSDAKHPPPRKLGPGARPGARSGARTWGRPGPNLGPKPGPKQGPKPGPRPGPKPGINKIPIQRQFKPPHFSNDTPKRRLGDSDDRAEFMTDTPTRRLGDSDDQAEFVKDTPKLTLENPDDQVEFLINEKDDYANLGRQIASLVRKVDTKGEHEINLDYEKSVSGNISPQAMFNDNGMSSRSYWERFARSPFKFSFDTEQYSELDSTEKLLSLENQVSITATTKRTLTLQQVENLINIIETMKVAQYKQIHKNRVQPKEIKKVTSPLPEPLPTLMSKFNGWNNVHITDGKVVKNNQQPQKVNATNILYKAHIDIDYKKSPAMKFNDTQHGNIQQTAKTNQISAKVRADQLEPDKQQHIASLPQRFKMPLSRLLQNAAMQQARPGLPNRYLQNPKPIYLSQNQRSPNIVSYKSWSPSNGIIHYENVISAPHYPLGPLNKPSSYFHHQLHHFDYFD